MHVSINDMREALSVHVLAASAGALEAGKALQEPICQWPLGMLWSEVIRFTMVTTP